MTRKAAAVEEPSKRGIVGAFVFWGVAGLLALVTIPISGLPGWLWVFRGVMLIVGAGVVYGSLKRASDRRRRGLDKDRVPGIFDAWTIVHTTAGLVMGAWGVPFPLVALLTIGWEFYEYVVPGFGDTEIVANRATDVVVAWVGWIIVAGIVALITQTALPWLLPSAQSLLRGAGLNLF